MRWYRKVRAGAAPAAKSVLLHSGVYRALRKVRPNHQVAILRYHAICEPNAGYADPAICISPAAFERHVACLAADYRVLPLPDVVSAYRVGRSLPPNAVVITFDDGYADNLEAARTLDKYGVSGTFYITAGSLADGAPFWPSEIRTLVTAIAGPRVTLQSTGTPIDVAVGTPSERAAAIRQLTRLFKSVRIPVRERLRDELRALAPGAAQPRVMLTWAELGEMHRMGMTIGAHTLTHPNLPSAGLEDATAEIVGSKLRLERELGAAVTMFSYPNGGAERYYTPDLQRVVREAGYGAAATSYNGFAGPSSDLFALERVQVAERLQDLIFALEFERFAFKPQERSRVGA